MSDEPREGPYPTPPREPPVKAHRAWRDGPKPPEPEPARVSFAIVPVHYIACPNCGHELRLLRAEDVPPPAPPDPLEGHRLAPGQPPVPFARDPRKQDAHAEDGEGA